MFVISLFLISLVNGLEQTSKSTNDLEPTTIEKRLGFFEKIMSYLSVGAIVVYEPSGQIGSCNNFPTGELHIFSEKKSQTSVVAVGSKCSDNALVRVYECKDGITCNNKLKVAEAYRINGVSPKFTEWNPNNYFAYLCYDCQAITTQCTDSDGGKDYFKKGIAESTSGAKCTDGCAWDNPDILAECYCPSVTSKSVAWETYLCPNGCENGVCVSPTTQCTDGRVCTDSTHYKVCINGQWGDTLVCPSSIPICQNGICVASTTTQCTDSDMGKDYKNGGIVTFGENKYTDKCIDNKNLKEYYCENNIKKEEIKDCKEVFGIWGCVNNKCVECTENWHCVEKYGNAYTCSNNVCQRTGKTCNDFSDNYGTCLIGVNQICSSDGTYMLSECKDLDETDGETWCWTKKTNCPNGCTMKNLAIICSSETCSGEFRTCRTYITGRACYSDEVDIGKLDCSLPTQRCCEIQPTKTCEFYDGVCRSSECKASEKKLEKLNCGLTEVCCIPGTNWCAWTTWAPEIFGQTQCTSAYVMIIGGFIIFMIFLNIMSKK